MDKRYYSAVELIHIASSHAKTAESLLLNKRNMDEPNDLSPITSLLYTAFQITLKAYLLHVHRPVKQRKTLEELLDLNGDLGFSTQDRMLLKTLSRQVAFYKGINYGLWETPQQEHVFCTKILDLYERLQSVMPLELHPDYHKVT